MGLFKRKTDAADSTDALTPAEGVAGIGVAAMLADGVLDMEEDHDLAVHLGKMRVFRGLGEDDVHRMLQKLHGIGLRDGDDALLDAAVAAVPDEYRGTAFLLAADILLGDDEFDHAEKAFLGRVQAALGVDDATATKILDVLAIKHRG